MSATYKKPKNLWFPLAVWALPRWRSWLSLVPGW